MKNLFENISDWENLYEDAASEIAATNKSYGKTRKILAGTAIALTAAKLAHKAYMKKHHPKQYAEGKWYNNENKKKKSK